MSLQSLEQPMTIDELNIDSLLTRTNRQFVQISPTRVVYKLFDFLDTAPASFTIRPVQFEIPLCSIYFLDCLTVLSGYIIDVPAFHLSYHPYYLRIRRHECLGKTLFKATKFAWQDSNLNVIYSVEGATLVSPTDLQWIIKPNMVRKSDQKSESS